MYKRQNHLVLQKGRVVAGEPTLVRMHGISIFSDMLGQPGPRKRILQKAMEEVGRAGAGIIVILMGDNGEAMADSIQRQLNHEMDLRAYGLGAQILADLGVNDMILLTNSHRHIVAIEGHGLSIVGERAIPEA